MTSAETTQACQKAAVHIIGGVWRISFFFAQHPALPYSFVLLTALYAALITVPEPPQQLDTRLDSGWRLELNLAHVNNLVAGRDVIFTYGPLGYLITPDPVSGTAVAALIYHMGLHLVWVAALFRIVAAFRVKVVAFWVIVILALGVVLDGFSRENRIEIILIAVALIPLAEHTPWRYAELGVLAFLAALATMVKLNAGIEGAGVFLTVLAVVVYRDWPLSHSARRQALAALMSLPVWVVMLYSLSTGDPLSLWAYLHTGLEVVAGYTDGMGQPGPLWQAALDVAMLGFIFIGVPLLAVNLRPLWAGYAPALLAAFLELKHAMVRQDSGHATFFYIRFAVCLLLLFVCAKAARDRRLIVLFQVFALVIGYAIAVETFPSFRNDIAARLRIWNSGGKRGYAGWGGSPYSYIAAWVHWPSTWQDLGDANARNRSSAHLGERFDRIVGQSTVASIPWNVHSIKAHNWKWRPLPVIGLYSAYTPVLDRINAAHIESKSAADFALVDFSDIDSRHPFLSAPLTWRAVLDWYDVETKGDQSDQPMLLRHRQTSRFTPPVLLGAQVTGWNQDVTVPQIEGFLLMSPRITKSLTGKIVSFLFRSSPVYLETQFNSGKTIRWRTTPANIPAGVLIHPFPQNQQGFYSLSLLASLRLPDERIRYIRFQTGSASEYGAEIAIQWSRLPVKTAATGLGAAGVLGPSFSRLLAFPVEAHQ